jgi:hypothetical protein
MLQLSCTICPACIGYGSEFEYLQTPSASCSQIAPPFLFLVPFTDMTQPVRAADIRKNIRGETVRFAPHLPHEFASVSDYLRYSTPVCSNMLQIWIGRVHAIRFSPLRLGIARGLFRGLVRGLARTYSLHLPPFVVEFWAVFHVILLPPTAVMLYLRTCWCNDNALLFFWAVFNPIPSYAWDPPPTAGCRGSTCSITFEGRVVFSVITRG